MEENRNLKKEKEDKIRCANYLLQMLEKYGAEIMAERNNEKSVDGA